jgi:hypothetical protein
MHISKQKILHRLYSPLAGGSRILTAIDFDLNIENIARIKIINHYNPPKNFEGLDELHSWLNSFNDRKIPSFLLMDSNLHHRLWNPPKYPHNH